MVAEAILAEDVANGRELRVGVQHIDWKHRAVDATDPRGTKRIRAQELSSSASRLLELDMVDKDVVEGNSQWLVVEAIAAIHNIHASFSNNLVVEVTSKEADPLVFLQRGLLDASAKSNLVAMVSSRVNMHNDELERGHRVADRHFQNSALLDGRAPHEQGRSR